MTNDTAGLQLVAAFGENGLEALELCGVPGSRPIRVEKLPPRYQTARLAIALVLFAYKAKRHKERKDRFELTQADYVSQPINLLASSFDKTSNAEVKALFGLDNQKGKDFWAKVAQDQKNREQADSGPWSRILQKKQGSSAIRFRSIMQDPPVRVVIGTLGSGHDASLDELHALLVDQGVTPGFSSATDASSGSLVFPTYPLALDHFLQPDRHHSPAQGESVTFLQLSGQTSWFQMNKLLSAGLNVNLYIADPDTAPPGLRSRIEGTTTHLVESLEHSGGPRAELRLHFYSARCATMRAVWWPERGLLVNPLCLQPTHADKPVPIGHDPSFVVFSSCPEFESLEEFIRQYIASLTATRPSLIVPAAPLRP